MPRQPKPITATLKAAIKASSLTHYAIAKLADITPGQVDRFMTGERDLRLETAGRIAAALGLELRAV
jgi:plasmid maintenance system antidote protein VapI